jgi:hypothetical protein
MAASQHRQSLQPNVEHMRNIEECQPIVVGNYIQRYQRLAVSCQNCPTRPASSYANFVRGFGAPIKSSAEAIAALAPKQPFAPRTKWDRDFFLLWVLLIWVGS